MRPAIRVENLSKCYRVNDKKRTGQNLSETIASTARVAWDKVRQLADPNAKQAGTHEFWALKDVSFEVQPGEVVGIIGRNGAGKSTLLKILSQIVEPTGGYAEIDGRVSSLLEVGTGFHPELTGRENVYLNATILGMKRSEINKKFDEIVDFSGIEEFLDTPVKRYSSGMYVRLAFAVAAHLQTEILIVDEVLAVGDQEFQKKCLDKMRDVANSGLTVLLVSHNIAVVEKLCQTALVLGNGRSLGYGLADDQIRNYIGHISREQLDGVDLDLRQVPRNSGIRIPLLTRLRISSDGQLAAITTMSSSIRFDLSYELPSDMSELKVGIVLEDMYGTKVTAISPSYQCPNLLVSPPRCGTVSGTVHKHNLTSGKYFVNVYAETHGLTDAVEGAAQIEIIASDVFNTGRTLDAKIAVTYQDCSWTVAAIGGRS